MPPSSRYIDSTEHLAFSTTRRTRAPGGSARHKEGAEALKKVEEALMNEEEAKTKERMEMEFNNPENFQNVDPHLARDEEEER